MPNRLKLVKKLRRNFGTSGKLLAIICDFLLDREANLKVGGDLGQWIPSKIGTSAGTVLGPILFIAFVEDLPIWCSLKFADDVSGLAMEESPGLVERRRRKNKSSTGMIKIKN